MKFKKKSLFLFLFYLYVECQPQSSLHFFLLTFRIFLNICLAFSTIILICLAYFSGYKIPL